MAHYKTKIRTKDTVKIIAGNHKGETSTVISVNPKKNTAIVENVNLRTHYVKPTREDDKGGMEKKEGPIHLSNLALINPKTKKVARVVMKKDDNGKRQRYDKQTGNPF
ncbi:MAG: 50S ribosomal protein L24 [Bacteroidota bacterium]